MPSGNSAIGLEATVPAIKKIRLESGFVLNHVHGSLFAVSLILIFVKSFTLLDSLLSLVS